MASLIPRPEEEDVLPGEVRGKFGRMRELIRQEKLLISGKNENGHVGGGGELLHVENYARLRAKRGAMLVDTKTHDEGRKPTCTAFSVGSDHDGEGYLKDEDGRVELENVKRQKLEVALAAYEAIEGEFTSLTRGIAELEQLLAEEEDDEGSEFPSYHYNPHQTKMSNCDDQAVHTPLNLDRNCNMTAVEEIE